MSGFFNLSLNIVEGEHRNAYLQHLQNLFTNIELLTMNKLTFGDAIKGHLHEDLNVFEKKCDFIFGHIDDSVKVDILQALLTNLSGKALNVTQHKTITTYDELKTILRNNFGNIHSGAYLQKELNSIVQGKYERVRDYASRIELALFKLVNELTKDKNNVESKIIAEVIDKQAQHIFIDGLHFSLRTILRAMQLTTLENMIKAALEEEQAGENSKFKFENKNENSNFKGKKCYNCDKIGHLSKDCRKPKQQSYTGTYSKPKFETFIKKEFNSKISCKYCKKVGHEIGECRKLKYNN